MSAGERGPGAVAHRDEGLMGVLRRGDLLVLVVGALLLLGGWALRARQIDRSATHSGQGIRLDYPAGWIMLAEPAGQAIEAERVTLSDMLVSDTFKPQIVVSAEPLPEGLKAAELADYLLLNMQRQLTLFHRVDAQQIKLGQRPAVRLSYAYAVNPGARPDDPAATDRPVTVVASSLVLITARGLSRIDVLQSEAQRAADPKLAERVFASVAPSDRAPARSGATP